LNFSGQAEVQKLIDYVTNHNINLHFRYFLKFCRGAADAEECLSLLTTLKAFK